VQLDEFKKATAIFSDEYVYFSSMSSSWLKHSKAYVDQMTNDFGIDQNSLVTEIASNDGYLLQYFKAKKVNVIGIEPTNSTAKVAKEKGIDTVVDFFGERLATKLANEAKLSDLILGNNVLAHVPDINDFVKGIKILLKPDGMVTMEFPHLLQLVKYNQFDTIYHEHFSYLSFTTVYEVFKKAGLELFHVEEIPTHGGSLRIFGKHQEDATRLIRPSVEIMFAKEKAAKLLEMNYYTGFQQRVDVVKDSLLKFLAQAKLEGKKVAAYGAAAKGNTLLNYAGVKDDVIAFVVDAAPSKQNKFLPGSHIPVVEESALKKYKPDYIIVFPWNIKSEIMNQLAYVKEWDAKFVIFIPELQII
jgi:2-polyprenyl-3-methyl-5-hydroxy-6-metoxy-1,4-benzoquinol methylase